VRLVLAALAAAALVAGCGEGTAPTAAVPTATATPTPTLPPSEDVEFKASDGETVTAKYTPAGDRAPALVLLHEIHGAPDQWDGLVPALHDAGFATLAYSSRTSPIEHERVKDTLGAVRWLRSRPDVARHRIGIVGASIGASTAVFAMATLATVDAAVALSPPDTPDVWKLQETGRYRAHDLLLISDEAESATAESMRKGAARSRTLRSRQPGHGIDLLSEPGVRRALLAWLDERVSR
jgi:dienelactone hydrolase